MHAAQMEAYRTAQKSSGSPREVEAAVLTRAALLLKACQDNWAVGDHEQNLREALRVNQMIWNIFQTELASVENPMPRKLREDILSLSAFIDRRILEVMACPARDKLKAIIDINLNLAAGLRGSAG